jgi:alkanesulfonate monooxygenase SsuD/methylene tetrahydromethanopterin reductase-like flavin-dependent oxidoreductase (luciferase family)
LRGSNLPQKDIQRRLSTTVSGLTESARRVQAIAAEAGRPPVRISLLINYIVFCAESERAAAADRIRADAALSSGSLDECPYVFIGEPERMRATLAEWQSRFGVQSRLLSSGTISPETSARFVEEVLS